MKKKLTKSKNKVFLGVCGGLANYLHVDPTVVRLIVLVLLVMTPHPSGYDRILPGRPDLPGCRTDYA